MKRIFLSILALLSISLANGQGQDVIFKVTNYEIDGVNYDDLALKNDGSLIFYLCDYETVCFANYWKNLDTQSYGGIYALKSRDIPETSTTYAAEEFTFTWQFFNSYDEVSGEADVTFTKIYFVNMVRFIAEILVPETNRVLLLEGYME